MLTIKNLTKRHAGKKALNGLNMTIESGQIVGLLGPNGSGKTTLMKTIAGLLTPDAGEISLRDKSQIAFLPDKMVFPDWMKVSDAFTYYQRMYPDYDPAKAAEMHTLLNLTPTDKITKLSKGMQERVALGVTFARKAPLYLLDEPLGGIDPVGRHKVLESIIAAHNPDSSILLSTHLIKDVEAVFDSVLFIKKGQIVFEGNCEDMRGQSGKKVEDMYLEVFGDV